MLRMKNNEGDIALHKAMRNNYIGVVEILTKEDLEFYEGDTTLHVDVRNDYIDVMEILTIEDPKFSYSANNFGKTPLYIATKGRSLDIVTKILETCKSGSHASTNRKIDLHALVLSEDLGNT
ncbi:hypothetical protein Patl1_10453 [Pistacia atlantica]|uniref:Uncharacterized protein n=1 Tax=Pistacia atlantica TaxID=434234 RepID=A0ACC1A7K5_9ROSI|nr:hypothetical protein Patl1_10453 [Pistacia atlantica]